MAKLTNALMGQLIQAIRACQRCDLPHGCHPVIGAGADAELMLIGQAPGRTEPGLKMPFMGKAGRRLFQWFATIGWSEALVRQRFHMTAMTKCFPGPAPGGKGDRRPSPAELAACRPFLDQELALVRPQVIVLIGQMAISRFLPGRRLREVVGREFHHAADWGTAWLIPLPHPSGASLWLNDPDHRALVERGLQALAARIGPGDLPLCPDRRSDAG